MQGGIFSQNNKRACTSIRYTRVYVCGNSSSNLINITITSKFQTPNIIVTCYQKFPLNLHFHAFTVFLVQCEFCCAEVIYFRKETPGNGTVFVVVERIVENLCSSSIYFSKKNRNSTPFTTIK